MSKKFNIKPPIWVKEYTFAEFAKLNSHIINENQLISLYNQYLNKYLEELGQKKIHFKQSKITQLLIELKKSQLHEVIDMNALGGGYQFNNNYSISFSGNTGYSGTINGDYVATTFDPQAHNLHNGFTVSFWLRPDEFPAEAHLFALGRKKNNSTRFTFGLNHGTTGYAYIGVGNTKFISTNTGGVEHGMSLGNWYHWVITFAGGTDGDVYFYINGVDMGLNNGNSESFSTPATTTWTAAADTLLFFGGRNTPASGIYDNGWACGLDEVAIFNEVKNLSTLWNGTGKPTDLTDENGLVGYWRFEEGSGTTVKDTSGNGNHGTFTNCNNQASPCKVDDVPVGKGAPAWSTDVPTK